ncbi:MAG TPA: ABC transporter ATP-binding protein [Myxococcaceae bacterium]|jgi:ABC-2 type transport system ATP-binding protein|nr:ABC transporter ATP-binding protein [Myxococcaceae bacterium]
MPPETTPADVPIAIRGLSKTYRLGFLLNRRVRALQQLDLTIAAGQVYGILGPNGAGKSTTLKILMNLVRPSAGSARIFGLPVESRDARRRVGFLPENPSPYEYLTGREFVQLAAQLTGVERREMERRVREVLNLVGMEGAADLHIRRYSKGMVQRIGLAQALINRPDLLILDEPTSGLDPVGRRQMRDIILRERERGATVLFCTHIIPDVEALCDRVAVLVGGRLVKEGRVHDLVTTQVPLFEVGVEGVEMNELRTWNIPVQEAIDLAGRLRVRLGDHECQALLARIVQHKAKVTSVQPVRFSLEELFLEELKRASGPAIGGEIS